MLFYIAKFAQVAILEYLEEVYPETPLLPKNPATRARVWINEIPIRSASIQNYKQKI